MITRIEANGALIALHIGTDDIAEGTHPITDPSYALQMLMMKRGAGHVFAKHTHTSLDRSTSLLQEAIVVTKGKVRVTVCLRNGTDIGAYDIVAGECLMLVDGGYTIEVLEDTIFYEFKNGPFKEDKVLL